MLNLAGQARVRPIDARDERQNDNAENAAKAGGRDQSVLAAVPAFSLVA